MWRGAGGVEVGAWWVIGVWIEAWWGWSGAWGGRGPGDG